MYYSDMHILIDTFLRNEEIIICRGTASSVLGLSNRWRLPLEFYTTNKDFINSSSLIGHYVESLEDMEPYTTEIRGRKYTNLEYTTCDVILHTEDMQTVLETLAGYYFRHKESVEGLLPLAKQLGAEARIGEHLEHATEYYND